MDELSSGTTRIERLAALVLTGEAIFLIALLAYTTWHRIGFPYELEWLEGWTVESIKRLGEGKSLFVAPTIDWLPYIYTPLYTYVSAGLAEIVGVGFLAPRLVSLASAAGALAFAFAIVRRETRSVPFALVAAGFLAGTYPLSGTWFDVARVDTTFLFFVLAAFWTARSFPTARGSLWAGILMALAYLSKQTALLPLASVSLYSLSELRGWKRVVLPCVAGGIIGGSTLLFSYLSDGWYFYYTITVPSLHGFGQEQQLVGYWTQDLGWTLAIALGLGLVHLARALWMKRHAYFVFYATATVGMLGAAWTSRLHGGGWINVLQPAHAMLAILFGLALVDLRDLTRRWGTIGAVAYALPMVQLGLLAYQPAPHIPTASDVADGDAFIAALTDIEGDVYTPMHAYLPTLAGKRSFVIDGYLLTVLRTGDERVVNELLKEFQEAFVNQRFAAVVIDYEDYRFMHLLGEYYRPDRELPGSFRPRRGLPRAPQKLYLARKDRAETASGRGEGPTRVR